MTDRGSWVGLVGPALALGVLLVAWSVAGAAPAVIDAADRDAGIAQEGGATPPPPHRTRPRARRRGSGARF